MTVVLSIPQVRHLSIPQVRHPTIIHRQLGRHDTPKCHKVTRLWNTVKAWLSGIGQSRAVLKEFPTLDGRAKKVVANLASTGTTLTSATLHDGLEYVKTTVPKKTHLDIFHEFYTGDSLSYNVATNLLKTTVLPKIIKDFPIGGFISIPIKTPPPRGWLLNTTRVLTALGIFILTLTIIAPLIYIPYKTYKIGFKKTFAHLLHSVQNPSFPVGHITHILIKKESEDNLTIEHFDALGRDPFDNYRLADSEETIKDFLNFLCIKCLDEINPKTKRHQKIDLLHHRKEFQDNSHICGFSVLFHLTQRVCYQTQRVCYQKTPEQFSGHSDAIRKSLEDHRKVFARDYAAYALKQQNGSSEAQPPVDTSWVEDTF